MPRFRKRLSHQRPGGLRWRPNWEHDAHFEVAAHVRHATLPAPGGEAELLDWMADFYSHRLDRSRPLWEITLLDGLAGGRWALVTKVHHCLVDGVSGVSVTNLILDVRPNPPQRARRHAMRLRPRRAPDHARRIVAGARAGIDLALHPHRIRRLTGKRSLARFIAHDELIPAPHVAERADQGNRRIDRGPRRWRI